MKNYKNLKNLKSDSCSGITSSTGVLSLVHPRLELSYKKAVEKIIRQESQGLILGDTFPGILSWISYPDRLQHVFK